jgi:radical SAM superfamily enzyme YgiQ (UPF0313 family)
MADIRDVIIFTEIDSPYTAERAYGGYKVAHELRLHGYTTLVINFFSWFTIEELNALLDKYLGEKTLFVGFSTTFFRLKNKFKDFVTKDKDFENALVKMIKEKNNNCKIVIGGAYASEHFQNKNVDYSILGFADLSIVNLADHLKYNKPLKNSYKNLYGVTIIKDLLSEGFDFRNSTMQWLEEDCIQPGEYLPLEISRGCIFKCKFCSSPLTGRSKNAIEHIKDISILKKELLENYEKYKTVSYRILDDTFNDDVRKIDHLLEVAESLPFELNLWGYMRLDLLTANIDTLDKLVKIGFKSFYFGIETLHPVASKIIGKGGNKEKQIETIRLIKKKYPNISLFGGFIAGLPEETPEDAMNTFNRLFSDEIPLDYFMFHPLEIFRKTSFVWESEFNINFQDYGYEISENDNGVSDKISWKNKHWTYESAQEFSNITFEKNKTSGRMRMHANLAFCLLNYGYSWEEIANMTLRIEIPNIIKSKKKFIDNYKSLIFSLK